MSPRTLLRGLGWVLTLVCLGYIFWRFARTDAVHALLNERNLLPLLGASVAGAVIYSGALCLLGLAWWRLQTGLSERKGLPLRPVLASYAVSQFAKYLPGNVMHYAARHGLLRRHDVPHKTLMASALIEAGSLVTAAVLWSLLGARGVLEQRLGIDGRLLLAVLVALAGLALFALAWGAPRWQRLQRWLPVLDARQLLWLALAHLVFFALMGVALCLPALALGMPPRLHLLPVVAASWVIGFVVIGAPGGLGVREAVFVELLRGTQPEVQILLLAAALRVITFVGDAIFFGFGTWLRRGVAVADATESSA